MRAEIERRIEQIKNGEIPNGYTATKAGVLPKWDCVRLNQIAEPITKIVGNGTYETLSISAGIGFVNQAKKFGKELSGKQYEKYTVLNRGDFSYNKGNSKSYPQGCIYRLKDRETAAVPNVFESFKIKNESPDYYEQLFTSGYLNKQLSKKINHGVRDNGLLNLTEKDFYSCYVPHPPIAEQQKIAEILMQCDKLIELYQNETDELQKLKKICLCNMFPKNGNDIPKWRFPQFTDAWEQRKFGDLGSVAMCKRIFKEQTSANGDIPFYKIGTFGAEPDAFISRELFEEYKGKFQYPNIGDMLISASGTIGRTVEYKGEEAYFQDSNIVWFKHDDRIDNSFLKCIYEIVKWSGIEGSTIKRLYNDNFLKTEFSMPKVAEQQQIGMYFQSLDHLITLHQRKLAGMEKQKKSLTQLLLTGIVRVSV